MKRNQTRKKQIRKDKGGNIHDFSTFKYILSIGYEVETDYLVKLTSAYNEEGNQILFNSDSNTRNLEYLDEQSSDEDEVDDVLRREEVLQIDAINHEGKIDKDIKFLVTNDIASTSLSKKLNPLCCPSSLDVVFRPHSESKMETEESKYCGTDVPVELKNKLYKFYTPNDFETESEKEYNIEFVYFDKTECGIFSDVEWVVTYYKPLQHENIIVDTLKNVVLNLTRHLESMKKVEGNLIMNEIEVRDEKGELIDTYPEMKITNPIQRYLFKSPKYNLYYLQSNNSKEFLNIDEICPTFQMTFSANIVHIFSILKKIIDDKKRSILCSVDSTQKRLEILQKIEYCVEQLLQNYNQTQNKKDSIKINKTESNQNTIKMLKGYLGLFLFRLYIYYNVYLDKEKNNTDKKNIYFKDSLFFNPRHSNYDFYLAIKRCLKELLPHSLENNIIIELIHNLILQPNVLNELLLEKSSLSLLSKSVFEKDTKVEKENVHYGDPIHSLASYLTFFEKPVDNDSNLYEDDTIIYYDWLQYKGVDKVSTQMDIRDDIILVEVRNFQKIMSSYVYGFADESLKRDIINNKKCNKLDKMCVLGISLGNLKKFFQLDKKNSMNRSQNNSQTRKKISNKKSKN